MTKTLLAMKYMLSLALLLLPLLAFSQKKRSHVLQDTIYTDVVGQKGLQQMLIRNYKGLPVALGHLQDGIPVGYWYELHPADSVIKKITPYKNGQIHGLVLSFTHRLSLTKEAFYANGQLDGTVRTFKNGRVLGLSNYKAGLLDGFQKKFYEKSGKVSEEANYKAGVKHGTTKWFHETGELLTSYQYDMGKINGKVEAFWQDGTSKTVFEYVNNEKEGDYISYYVNGKVKLAGQYVKSKKHGIWKYYDEQGKMIKTETYEKGKLKDGQ